MVSAISRILLKVINWSEEERKENIKYAEENYKSDSEFVRALKILFCEKRASELYEILKKRGKNETNK